MRYRPLGKIGYPVSDIGFGAWGIGGGIWKGGEDGEALRALNRAVDLGLNFIDTALAYGGGHSERLIAKLLKARTERIYVATKVPPKTHEWPARKGSRVREVFPKEHIIACTEESLKNLGVARLDLQQLHVWAPNWKDELEWHETFLQLQKAGKIAHFGISINDHDPDSALEVIRAGLVQTVQVIYNIFDPAAASQLFPLCQEKEIGVIVRCPLDEGALTGVITPDTHFAPDDWREQYFTTSRKEEIAVRIGKISKVLNEANAGSLAELALRFCLSHPAVSTVIPGMRKFRNVNQNLPVSDMAPLSKKIVQKLASHAGPRNFYA